MCQVVFVSFSICWSSARDDLKTLVSASDIAKKQIHIFHEILPSFPKKTWSSSVQQSSLVKYYDNFDSPARSRQGSPSCPSPNWPRSILNVVLLVEPKHERRCFFHIQDHRPAKYHFSKQQKLVHMQIFRRCNDFFLVSFVILVYAVPPK